MTEFLGNSVSVIDTTTNAVTSSFWAGARPYGVTTSPDGSILYVASAGGTGMYNAKTKVWISNVGAVDANTKRTVAVSPDGQYIYTTNMTEDLLRTTSIVRGNTAPVATAAPTVGTPDPILGAVTGKLNVTDPDGDYLSYSVTGPLPAGTVTFDTAAGIYTITPNQAAREEAARTEGPDYATFTVTASDEFYPGGPGSIDVTVTVPIAPSGAAIPVTTTPINLGPSPGKVIVQNGQLYVYNYSNNTVMVINPATNQVTATVPVPAASDFVVRPDGRIYVSGYDMVSVIGPDGRQVVPPIQIPDLCAGVCYGSAGGITDLAINRS
jgi:YVTN family beta-propeller protein